MNKNNKSKLEDVIGLILDKAKSNLQPMPIVSSVSYEQYTERYRTIAELLSVVPELDKLIEIYEG